MDVNNFLVQMNNTHPLVLEDMLFLENIMNAQLSECVFEDGHFGGLMAYSGLYCIRSFIGRYE